MAEEGLVGLGVVVGAFDEDAFEEARDDLRRCVAPDLCCSRGEREGVWFDVAEDEHFLAATVVPNEEGRAVVDAGIVDWVGVLQTSDGTEMVRGRGAERGSSEGDVCGYFGLRAAVAAAVAVALHAVAVTDAPAFDIEAVAHFDVAHAVAGPECHVAAFYQAHVGDQSDPAIFVGEVRPDDVVEDVIFDRIDGGWKGGETLGPIGMLERGGVDGETGKVVQVRVRYQVSRDQCSIDICRICFCCLIW